MAIGVIWLVQRFRFSRSNSLPPGPRGLPWIGYTPCLGSQAFDELQRLKSRYGDVVSFTLFGTTVVLLNTYETIHEAANNSNRQKLGRYTLTTNHWLAKGFGISNYDTPRALELRQALLRHLYGYEDVANYLADDSSPSELRETVRKEIRQLIQTLTLSEAKSVEFLPLARLIVWNVMWTIVFGRSCEISPAQIKHVLDQISRNNKENSMLQAIQLFPKQWLFIVDRIPWIQRFLKMDRLYSRYAEVNAVLRDQLRLHDTKTDNSPKALINRFRNDRGLDIERNELERLLFELMAAGTDTSSLTLTAACIYLSEQTGPLSRDRFRDHLNHIHRQANVVPLALPHVAREPIQLAGYSIPAHSIVIFNLYAVHQLQLSQICPFSPIPFSVGSRVCPGQRLASKVIEDIVWALDQHFIVEKGCIEHATNLPNGSVQMKPSQASRGLTRTPKISTFIFHRRSNS
ncbi:Cytochrome P450 1A1 [Fasciolopsis buskii]|uniref:Cytochrome P450 1A1 n=1 Tax=Fasciolopsis buskii TaxID=27845 RepID=A0A8E0RKX6_9TREM|nr:Cytochrome P450 1A1 [Fasciolopsis buski]